MKKVNPRSSNYRPHFVDESTETVYITADNWSSAGTAPHWVKRHYPAYQSVLVSKDKLTELQNEN